MNDRDDVDVVSFVYHLQYFVAYYDGRHDVAFNEKMIKSLKFPIAWDLFAM